MNAIYISIDRNYERYARACFNSIERNYPKHPIVLVHADDLSDEFTRYVSTLNNFTIVNPPKGGSYKNLGPVNNPIVYNKYKLWSSVFCEYDSILHLDADTLVLKPLDRLFEEEFFIVDDCSKLTLQTILRPNEEAQQLLKDNNIDIDVFNQPTMANAGVFVISRKYRNKTQFNSLLELTKQFENHLNYADQSAISLWCYKNKIPISSRLSYNYQSPFFKDAEKNRSLDSISVLHFTAKKPDTINFLLWCAMEPDMSKILVSLYNEYK